MAEDVVKLNAFWDKWHAFIDTNLYRNPGFLTYTKRVAASNNWNSTYTFEKNNTIRDLSGVVNWQNMILNSLKSKIINHFVNYVNYPVSQGGLGANLPQAFLTNIAIALNNDNPTFTGAAAAGAAGDAAAPVASTAPNRNANSELLKKYIDDVANYILTTIFQNDNVRLVLNQGLVPAYIVNLNNMKSTLENNLPPTISTEEQFNIGADTIMRTFTTYVAALKDRGNNSLPQQFLNSALSEINRLRPNNPLTPPPPAVVQPVAPAAVVRDVNSKSLFDYIMAMYNYTITDFLGNPSLRATVNQGLVPAYIANLQTIMSGAVQAIPGTINDEQQFNTLANQSLSGFTAWFAGLRSQGAPWNPMGGPMPQAFLTAVLSNFTALMPRYNGVAASAAAAAPTPTPTPTPTPAPAPQCPPSAPCPALDSSALKEAGSTLVALANAEIAHLRSLLDNTIALNIFDKHIKQVDEQSSEYVTKLQRTSMEKNALEQQFIDERKTPEKISNSKVRVLQDYLLAGFAISYVLASLVGITYTTIHANYWPTGLFVSSGTATLVGGVIFSLTLHLA